MYTLNWQPPYDWSWMFGFLAARAVTGVETVTEDYYERSCWLCRAPGRFPGYARQRNPYAGGVAQPWPDPGGGYLPRPHRPPV